MSKERMIDIGVNLKTVSPDMGNVRRMQSRIQRIGDSLGSMIVVPYEIPDKFLESSLTTDQRKLVDAKLAIDYATQAVRLQDEIAKVPIVENGEPFLQIPSLFERDEIVADFSDTPFHASCGEWAGKPRDFWVRRSMGERLVDLGRAFNSVGLKINFEDGFRPIGVQEGLFKRRVDWTKDEHPDWSYDQVILEARSKTAVTPRLASHKGGAAVDMTLKTIDGVPLDLGNKYPEGGALVVFDCPFVTQEQWETRQIFSTSAKMAGFAVYPGEDWHISLGDNLASLNIPPELRSSYNAIYGPVKNFDRITGDIQQVYSDSELDIVFPISN